MSVPRLPPKNPEDYQVGWICALPKERTAAVAMLDIRHNSLPRFPDDTNIYELGSMGSHNVVIACLPKGKYGTVPAATVANNLMRTFPAIKFGLMVGIGGGIPPKVRLGDVVISVPVGPLPGVVQWDMGKAELGGVFKRTGVLSNPPPLLLGAVSIMESEQELNGSKVPDFLDDLAQKFPRLASGYLKPDAVKDVLFKASYAHVRRQAFDEAEDEYEEEDDNCDLCDKQQAVKRKPRDMKVHYGTIASGNQVIKYAHRRNALVQELGGDILCVEMEAAGLMDNFPCIVIRGICDYADDHKNKAWQKHAAAVAAASAKELLGHIVPDDIDALQSARDILAKISQTVETVHLKTAETNKFLSKKNTEEFLDWLSMERYATQQSDTLKQWQAGTCGWFLDSPIYQNWIQGTQTTLFCPGIPGAGKTVMSCAVIHTIGESIAVDSKVGLAYVYFAFSRQNEQTVEHVLASLLAQLLRGVENPPSHLSEIKDNGGRPTRTQLIDQLCLAASGYQKVFIVLDALDECSTKEQCRTAVLNDVSLLQSRTGIRILATSRYDDDIASRLKGPHASTLPISAREEDVERFLTSEIRNFDPDIFDADFVAEVASNVVKVTDGMFLLAKLHLNTLLDSPTKGSVKRSLGTLSSGPNALEKVYDLALERIQQQGNLCSELAHSLLMWIVHARRPLSTPEIQHALAIQYGTSELDKNFIPSVKKLKSICAGLVTLDEDSNIIRLVHYTTQEYFVKTSKFATANVRITEACVTYLSFSCFDDCTDTDLGYQERKQMHPFYKYAASEWIHHAQVCTDQGAIIEFLKKDPQVEAASQAHPQLGDMKLNYDYWDTPKNVNGLHLAALFGLRVAAEALVEVLDVNAIDASGATPLFYAARSNDVHIVKLLLESGQVDIHQGDKYGSSPLSFAIMHNNTAMIKLLLETGQADTGLTNRYGLTLMENALKQDNLEIIRMVLEKCKLDYRASSSCGKIRGYWHAFEDIGVIEAIIEMDMLDIEEKDGSDNSLLWMAAREGNLRMVELLLNNNEVNPDIPGEYGWTPLTVAVMEGHHEIIELFLKTGKVNIDAGNYDRCGTSPIRHAIEHGKLDVTMKLLDGASVVVNPRYSPTWYHWQTALGKAVSQEWWEVVELLFEKNQVLLEQMDKKGYTTLSWAAHEGHTDVVKLILDRKPLEALVKDKFGDTPVYLAALSGHQDVVTILLEAMAVSKGSTDWKAYIKVTGETYTAISRARMRVAERYGMLTESQVATYVREITLHALAGEGTAATVRFCFKSTRFNINAKDIGGKTPLHWAAESGSTEVVELLLSTKQVDLTIRDYIKGWEPLYWAIQNDHAGVVKLLLPHSSPEDSNEEDLPDETPMLLAARTGSSRVMELLLKTDTMDPNVEDRRDGRITLHWAAVHVHTETFSLLLSRTKSEDVDTKGRDGKTALHLAAEYSRPGNVKLLLETGKVDLKAKDEELGRNALHWAIGDTTADVDVVKLLLAKVDAEGINAKDKNGCTPVSLNAKCGCIEILKLLLETKKVDLDAKDNDGRTPVTWAMENNVDQVALLSGGA